MSLYYDFSKSIAEETIRQFAFRDLAFSYEDNRRILFYDYTHENMANVTARLVSEFNSAYRAVKRTVQTSSPLEKAVNYTLCVLGSTRYSVSVAT